MIDRQEVYQRLPDDVKQVAKRGYYTAHPNLSWPLRRKMDEVDGRFVDRFFDSREEFEDYRREFLEGRVVDVCKQGVMDAPEDVSIYDAHVTTCVKLYSLIRKRTPETLVETGVFNGVSTLSILLALDRNGTGVLHSVDNSKELSKRHRAEGAGSDLFVDRGRPSCAEAGSSLLPPDADPGWPRRTSRRSPSPKRSSHSARTTPSSTSPRPWPRC